ncbi:MAG: Mu transposase C-terminal domain-containing protein [Nitrospirae bacterium]|nr:Mu transposase C-terminal domain-containing protein [Nitrospirota bacterium]
MRGDLVTLQQLAGLEGVPYDTIKKAYQRQAYSLVQIDGDQPFIRIIDPAISTQAKDRYFNPTVPAEPAGTFPPETQGEVMTLPASLPSRQRKDSVVFVSDLKEWQRDCMNARIAIIRAIEGISAEQSLSVHRSISRFLELINVADQYKRLITLANHRDGKNRTISDKSIYRWFSLFKKYGILGLAPEDTEKLIVPAWADRFLSLYRLPGKPSVPQVLEMMGADAPSYGQAVRFMKKFSRIDAQRGRMTGSELRSIGSYCIRDKSNLLPLDVIVADGHSLKAKVAHPAHGKPFNPEVEGIIDVRTRVCLGWSAGLAESAQIVADALRHAVTVNERKLHGGVMAILYTDGGAGNKAKMISAEVTGILARIGTQLKIGIPGNPMGRGIIEVLQKTMWVRAARMLPTFTGANMDNLSYRKTIRLVEKDIKENRIPNQMLSWPQFLEFCQQTVDAYNNRPHSALPKITSEQGFRRHMTPLEMWGRFVGDGWQATTLNDDEIRDLFKPQITCIARNGMVRVFGNIYYNKILEHYHGDQVCVNYDIHDPKLVWVRDRQQRLICEAVFEANKRSYFPVSVIEQARERRAQGRLKRLEDKISEVQAERNGTMETEIHIPEEMVDCHSREGGNPEDTPQIFDEAWQRYEHLMQQDEMTPEEMQWLEDYKASNEYKSIYGKQENAAG